MHFGPRLKTVSERKEFPRIGQRAYVQYSTSFTDYGTSGRRFLSAVSALLERPTPEPSNLTKSLNFTPPVHEKQSSRCSCNGIAKRKSPEDTIKHKA